MALVSAQAKGAQAKGAQAKGATTLNPLIHGNGPLVTLLVFVFFNATSLSQKASLGAMRNLKSATSPNENSPNLQWPGSVKPRHDLGHR